MLRLFALIICSLFGLWCQQVQAQDSAIQRLDSIAFLEQTQQKNVLLVDVRTKTEFKQGHLKRAKQVDFLKPESFEAYFKKIDTLKPVYLYCRSGNRSLKAAKYLESVGFKEIYDLKGGYLAVPKN